MTAPTVIDLWQQYGCSVIPVKLDKRPAWSLLPQKFDELEQRMRGQWKPYQERKPTANEIASWTKANAPAFAIVTGRISNRVTFDFDGEAGVALAQKWDINPHRKSGSGGLHLDVVYPGWFVPTLNSKAKREVARRWPGLDVKGDGGYCIAIGLNENGPYEWLRDPQPDPVDVIPAEVWEFLKQYSTPKPEGHTPNGNRHAWAYANGSHAVDAERLVAKALEAAGSCGRNNAGFDLACQLRDNGYSELETLRVMRNYRARVPPTNTKGMNEPYTETEITATVREVFCRPAREPWKRKSRTPQTRATNSPEPTETGDGDGPEPGGDSDLLWLPYTDTGNAERLVRMYGVDIRFCPEMKKWLFYDTRRWNSEDTRRVKMLVKKTMRETHKQAADISDKDKREAAERHARKSESAAAIVAALSCAEYEEGLPISANKLDTDPFLLNFKNGTLDLRTNCLYEHRREDLITKLVHFDYWPGAECPQFLRFLYRIMGVGPDASDRERERADRLVSYLQKCFGYALTGDVSEKVVFCFFGASNNGKTTLLEAIRYVLAEYSTQVLIDTLMAHHNRESNASLADLADLRGARFVTTSEAEEGQRLAVGKLKYLTQGMGDIKTCRKYENPIKFPATHKLFLDANHKPVIRGAEKAVWNRLKPLPFTVTIPPEEMDKGLLEKLKAEAEGILAWLVEGCRRWLAEGLGDPPEVTEASAAWQSESDRFAAFLDEKCIIAPEAWVPVAQLWPAYQGWCEANREKHSLSKSGFDERLEQLGCKRGIRDSGKVRAWVGIRFRTAEDDQKDGEQETEEAVTSDVT